jgi:hypothetical protein
MIIKSTFISNYGGAGAPSTNEISADLKDKFFSNALQELNQKCPDIVFELITTVANQQTYTISDSARVLEIFPNISGSVLNGMLGASGDDEILSAMSGRNEGGFYLSAWGSLTDFIEIKTRLSIWRKNAKPFTFKQFGSSLYIIPAPGDSGDYIGYIAKKPFTEATIPDTFESILSDIYLCFQLRFLATIRVRETGVMQGGGMISFPSEKLQQLANDYEESFEKKVKVQSAIMRAKLG